ncbi:MAG: serine/threonine protein kinase [Myxococcales bacterium]|nr:serine/threonine protein kinase [Myxococcales bacterium]
MIGATVGSYRIVSRLGVGGMGTVWRAEHVLIGKQAAIKVLRDELCLNEEAVNRFLNEARAATSIKHPGIVEVYDFGHMPSGEAYLAMEFLEGQSLAERIDAVGKLTEGEAAMILRGVCSALQAAHAKGIVHRDLKPDNIFLVADAESPTGERAKILDFGIAKLTDTGPAGRATKTGAVIGTPTYMSPEQCRGAGVVDARADLYSLGCIFYELVTGRPPFIELGAGELIGAHLFVEPEPVATHLPAISAEASSLIMGLLAKDPAVRPQTAKEVSQRLVTIGKEQGWITQTAPTGITAPHRLATPPPVLATPVPERAATAPTQVAGKPTTLSGAASSIIDVPRRTNRTLAIALAASALLAGGLVAFVKLHGGGSESATTTAPGATAPSAIAPASEPTPTPTPTPASAAVPEPATPTPVEPAAPAAIEPATPAAAEPARLAPTTPAATAKPPATASNGAAKPTAPAPKPAKLPGKPPASPPRQPAKPPKTPSLIETDL